MLAAPNYTEMYTDADGETHFRNVQVKLSLVDVAPPAAPMNVSEFRAAREVGFITLPSGWAGGWHPAPSVGHIFVLSGELEVEVSDGEIRRFPQGSVWLHTDLTGKGHDTRVISEGGAVLVMVKMGSTA
ncbi:MAG: cupin domain-containing protein [Burkholderiales bacterium]